ncbi:MAG TPA: rhodanese-like domain-containing protein [Caulobacter sp.]|nr:rhodanese-like domain-containing protein [Caulobacter sp.]
MSGQTYDQLAQALHQIRGRLGDAILADRRRLSSLLMDAAPEAKREIRVIGTAIDEGVPAALQGAERRLLGLEMDRQANRLESSTGLRLDIALQVVRILTYALDLGPLPSVYQGGQPAPAPPADGWAGMSQPTTPAQPVNYAPQPVNYAPQPAYPTQPAYNPGPGYAPPPASAGFLDKLPFDRKYLVAGGGVLVAVVGGMLIFNQMGRAPGPDPKPPGPEQAVNYAGELNDMGVAAKPTLESNVGSPTPLGIPVGRRIATTELQKLIAQDPSTLLIDVLADSHSSTIRNAIYLPLAGYPGTTSDNIQGQVAGQLKTAVGNQPQRPLVFFCAGAQCWESYNAVLRAGAAGYRNLYWYRGGLASWQAAGLPFQPLQPAPPPQKGAAANMFGP